MSRPKQNTPMTTEAAARIHSTQAKQGGGQVTNNSFTARVQRTVANKK
jgi:hypothetical protein